MLLLPANFFSKLTLQKFLSGTLPECQTDWSKVRTNILLVLIWIQTVCKGISRRQVAASKERVIDMVGGGRLINISIFTKEL